MEEKKELTKEQAKLLLPDREWIHTFVNGNINVLIGCDWKREEILTAIDENVCEIGGPACRAMGHGLAIINGSGMPLFVEAKEGVLEELEKCWEEA